MPQLNIFGVTALLLFVAHLSQARADPTSDIRAALAANARNDYATELKLLRPLADQGNAMAQALLGARYHQGRGVPQDDAEAVRWFRKAAEQGYAEAQGMLGVMYGGGQGVPKDEGEAARWFRKAAEQGDASAQ